MASNIRQQLWISTLRLTKIKETIDMLMRNYQQDNNDESEISQFVDEFFLNPLIERLLRNHIQDFNATNAENIRRIIVELDQEITNNLNQLRR